MPHKHLKYNKLSTHYPPPPVSAPAVKPALLTPLEQLNRKPLPAWSRQGL